MKTRKEKKNRQLTLNICLQNQTNKKKNEWRLLITRPWKSVVTGPCDNSYPLAYNVSCTFHYWLFVKAKGRDIRSGKSVLSAAANTTISNTQGHFCPKQVIFYTRTSFICRSPKTMLSHGVYEVPPAVKFSIRNQCHKRKK